MLIRNHTLSWLSLDKSSRSLLPPLFKIRKLSLLPVVGRRVAGIGSKRDDKAHELPCDRMQPLPYTFFFNHTQFFTVEEAKRVLGAILPANRQARQKPSLELRTTIIAAVQGGASQRVVGRRFGISRATVARLLEP